jgi:hypothetical protein
LRDKLLVIRNKELRKSSILEYGIKIGNFLLFLEIHVVNSQKDKFKISLFSEIRPEMGHDDTICSQSSKYIRDVIGDVANLLTYFLLALLLEFSLC